MCHVCDTEDKLNLTTNTEKKKRKTSFLHDCCLLKPRSTRPKQPALLAEFVEDLLKHEDGSRAAEDGERLASKEGIHHAGHGRAQQRLHGTLSGQERQQ